MGVFFDFLEVAGGGGPGYHRFMHYKIRVSHVPPASRKGMFIAYTTEIISSCQLYFWPGACDNGVWDHFQSLQAARQRRSDMGARNGEFGPIVLNLWPWGDMMNGSMGLWGTTLLHKPNLKYVWSE